METDLYQLFSFTKRYVESARSHACHGQKDFARDILRFVRNSHIVEVLKQYDSKYLPIDVSHLEWNLRELESDCHPASQSDFSDDFTKILSKLDIIAAYVAKTLPEQNRPTQ